MVEGEVPAQDLEAILRFLQVRRVQVEPDHADAALQELRRMAPEADGAVDHDVAFLGLERRQNLRHQDRNVLHRKALGKRPEALAREFPPACPSRSPLFRT